jgi:D-inositol-3-phosphate glycosyltransferase
MSLLTRSYLSPVSTVSSSALGVPDRHRPAVALISEHGDPAAEIGREAAGGQNVYVRQVGEALAALGWQVDMFTRRANPYDAEIVQHTPRCRTIRLVAGPQSYVGRDEMMEFMPAFVDSFVAFQAKTGLNYQLIHTHYWMSGWVGMQLKQRFPVQLVHTYHSLGAVKYDSGVEMPPIAHQRLAVEQQILESFDRVVATSPQEETDLRDLVSTVGNTQVIPCGTDIDNFQVLSKSEARSILNWDSKSPIVLYVGRFDQRKGIETLVRAVAEVKDNSAALEQLRLVVIGGSDPNQSDGQERCRIEAMTAELGIAHQTEFVGMVGHDRLPLYYSAADVCVVPSHYEPFGLVAIESMACGTPVVASNVGGLRFTVISEETGLLVEPQDVTGFARAIQRVLTDRLWAQKARKQAAIRVRANFSWSGVANQLSDLYKELIAQPPVVVNQRPVSKSNLKVS